MLSYQSFAGRLLRAPLRLIPSGATVPVLSGPARGLKWTVGSATHGCWIGSYERATSWRFHHHVKPGSVVFDIGANVGYYTLIAARSAGKVFAFEPLPENLSFLQRHIEMNRCANVVVRNCAVSDHSGHLLFSRGETRLTGQLTANGSMAVEAIGIDEDVRAGRLPLPDLMKIDVEGAENEVLSGALETLRAAHPTVFLATHRADNEAFCLPLLRSLGYRIEQDASDEWICTLP